MPELKLQTKRIHQPAARGDGLRYLVDGLWPRGVSKDEARLDGWLGELAPSDGLRRWYGHEPAHWGRFKQRYKLELEAAGKKALVEDLARRARRRRVTLLFAARDEEHNNAVALAEKIRSVA